MLFLYVPGIFSFAGSISYTHIIVRCSNQKFISIHVPTSSMQSLYLFNWSQLPKNNSGIIA